MIVRLLLVEFDSRENHVGLDRVDILIIHTFRMSPTAPQRDSDAMRKEKTRGGVGIRRVSRGTNEAAFFVH